MDPADDPCGRCDTCLAEEPRALEVPDAERLVSAGCAIQNMLLMATALGFGSALTTANSDRSLLLALPALAALAAFALPTLRRSVSALIDWFALLFFSGIALRLARRA